MCTFRAELPRTYELVDDVTQGGTTETYFEGFDASLSREKRKYFRIIERNLAALDQISWDYLRFEVVPFFSRRDPRRGWQYALDRLNEAKGYRYLADLGCDELVFIPRSSVIGERTPDLKGRLGSRNVLCDVKTINISRTEQDTRLKSPIRMVDYKSISTIHDGFFNKLDLQIRDAKEQMLMYDRSQNSKLICYSVINFDDLFGQNLKNYIDQIKLHCLNGESPGIDVIFETPPSIASISSGKPMLFRWADGCWTELGSYL